MLQDITKIYRLKWNGRNFPAVIWGLLLKEWYVFRSLNHDFKYYMIIIIIFNVIFDQKPQL